MSGNDRAGERRVSPRPSLFGKPKISCTKGLRRSQSTSSTRRPYDSLKVSASFVDVRVFPSLGTELVIINDLIPCWRCNPCSEVANRRYCSTEAGEIPPRETSFPSADDDTWLSP